MVVVLVAIVILGLACVDGWYLWRDKKWKELLAYSVLLLAGMVIIIMDMVSYGPFRFTTIIDNIFRPYFNAVKTLLGGQA